MSIARSAKDTRRMAATLEPRLIEKERKIYYFSLNRVEGVEGVDVVEPCCSLSKLCRIGLK